MNVIWVLLIMLCLLLMVGAIGFFFVGFPIWTIVFCAKSALSNRAKTIWIIVMILLWPLGSIIYSFAASQRRVFRIISIALMIVAALMFGLMTVSLRTVKTMTLMEIDARLTNFGQLDLSELTLDEARNLKSNLQELRQEIMTFSWKKTSEVLPWDMFEFFTGLAKDSTINRAEFEDWSRIFESRRLLDKSSFNEFLRKYSK